MPYIPEEDREQRRPNLPSLKPGELNFAITSLVKRYLLDHGTSYTTINAAIGVLECAKLELYRRIAAPYEDTKIIENGDVF